MKFRKATFKVAANTPRPHRREVECYVIQVPKWRPLTFCTHRALEPDGCQSKTHWVMSEMSTGRKCSQFSFRTRDEAAKDGVRRLDEEGRESVMRRMG